MTKPTDKQRAISSGIAEACSPYILRGHFHNGAALVQKGMESEDMAALSLGVETLTQALARHKLFKDVERQVEVLHEA